VNAQVLTFEGSVDGLRFGVVRFPGCRRHYLFDRLAGTVALFAWGTTDVAQVADPDPSRVSAALVALKAHDAGGAA
jgi:hypothetical protein